MITFRKASNVVEVKVNRTLFWYCLTLPSELHDCFDLSRIRQGGIGDIIQIELNEHQYQGQINCKHAEKNKPAYQITLPYELRKLLAKNFISSYILCTGTKGGKIPTDKQEILGIKVDSEKKVLTLSIERTTLSIYDEAFKNLLERNVFSLEPSEESKKNSKVTLLLNSTPWLIPEKLSAHADAINVIYTLLNEETGQYYIGKADKLGKRLTYSKDLKYIGHTSEDFNTYKWNKWRYDIVNVGDSRSLVQLEALLIHHTELCGVKLTNKQYAKQHKNCK